MSRERRAQADSETKKILTECSVVLDECGFDFLLRIIPAVQKCPQILPCAAPKYAKHRVSSFCLLVIAPVQRTAFDHSCLPGFANTCEPTRPRLGFPFLRRLQAANREVVAPESVPVAEEPGKAPGPLEEAVRVAQEPAAVLDGAPRLVPSLYPLLATVRSQQFRRAGLKG